MQRVFIALPKEVQILSNLKEGTADIILFFDKLWIVY